MILERIEALLRGELPRTAYRLNNRVATYEIEELVCEAHWCFYLLDLRNTTNKNGFMAAAAEALHLPAYFGHNWDAFEEVMNDFPFTPAGAPLAPGYFILVDRCSPLRYAAPETLRTALAIFKTVVEARGEDERPLVVLVRGAGPLAAVLPLLDERA